MAENLNREDALRLALAKAAECRRQLACQLYKRPELRGNPGAWLPCAIEGVYGPSVAYRRAQVAAARRARVQASEAWREAQAVPKQAQRPAYLAHVDQTTGEMAGT